VITPAQLKTTPAPVKKTTPAPVKKDNTSTV